MNIVKQILSSKKTRYIVYIVGILWLAVVTQIVMGFMLKDNVKITQAFMVGNSVTTQSYLEMAGECDDSYLTEKEKEEIIHSIGKKIGLTIDTIQSETKDNISQLWVEKVAKNAKTQINFVSVNSSLTDNIKHTKYYVLVKLTVYEKMDSIIEYKSLLESVFRKLDVKEQQSVIEFTGRYPGELSIGERNEITDEMIQRLGGRVAYENRSKELYTVYAYSGLIDEYITVAKNKVNIQVAMNYNEDTDETVVYLATPVLNGSY